MPVTASAALRNFLQQRLTSIDQIDIVLLLMRDPARAWTAPEVAAAVGTPQESAAMRLFLLASGGLIVFEPAGMPKYRYASGNAEADARLAELARSGWRCPLTNATMEDQTVFYLLRLAAFLIIVVAIVDKNRR